ncbi:sterol desaturase family protein [Novosphingobium sp. ES2-1]|uniref:sterol desaturase family protein n=1 Tax=Novosphingobium sp. ES2-1 TaxID=2780074 RepID=UPI00187E1371|nr:sterol desaturase family protein [Novosphingobium sp. ES2-1]QOV92953.1 sterol desaturase family protein [Novosphingobium sp. ES2-1]
MNIRKFAVDMLPPVTLAIVVSFWGLAPKAWVENTWTAIIMTALVTTWVLGLEMVFERHAGWRMNRQEFFTDLFYMVLNATLISNVSQLVGEAPLMTFKKAAGIETPWAAEMPFLAQVALVLFVYEFGQYWMHRLMHNSMPFWLTHAPHHHITQLNAMKGAVGNPIELVLISLSIVVLFDVSQAAVLGAFGATGVISTFAHANVRSDPPKFYSFFFTTICHHSLHHSVPYEDTRCNYGNSLILCDRIFGTYKEGEASVVGQDDRRRLSIREQWVFPFVPLFKAWQSRRANAQTGSNGVV